MASSVAWLLCFLAFIDLDPLHCPPCCVCVCVCVRVFVFVCVCLDRPNGVPGDAAVLWSLRGGGFSWGASEVMMRMDARTMLMDDPGDGLHASLRRANLPCPPIQPDKQLGELCP